MNSISKDGNLIQNFIIIRNKFLEKHKIELLYEMSFLDKNTIDSIFSLDKEVDDFKVIHIQHSMELILDKNSLYFLQKTLDFVNELYTDGNFRFDENEDGEMDDKDVEQLIELKRSFDVDIENKMKFLNKIV
ncbi:hypothetical protein ACSLMH_03355 [Flavobacterium columnare]|uniref:hypothetical protein n=1 Tax=Flavobacterium columnare TaxID=996 RepID=UPI00403347A9